MTSRGSPQQGTKMSTGKLVMDPAAFRGVAPERHIQGLKRQKQEGEDFGGEEKKSGDPRLARTIRPIQTR